jgi:sec-independent protein translocase protein TatB
MSFPHLIVIAVIALIVLGPEKLPQVARTLGKAMAEFRRITGDFRSTVENEMREMERTAALKDLREGFPSHVHYDVQKMNEETVQTALTPPPPAEFTGESASTPAVSTDSAPSSIQQGHEGHEGSTPDSSAKKTEAASASGNLSDGHPTTA